MATVPSYALPLLTHSTCVNQQATDVTQKALLRPKVSKNQVEINKVINKDNLYISYSSTFKLKLERLSEILKKIFNYLIQ